MGNSASYTDAIQVNNQSYNGSEIANTINGKSRLAVIRRSGSGKDVLSVSGDGGYAQNIKQNDWENMAVLFGTGQL